MIIWIHLTAAVVALGLGFTNLALAKGTVRHKLFGRLWVAAMACVTLSSFFIRELRDGQFSWLHGLTVWTMISVFIAIRSIRQGRRKAHAAWMIGTMIGVVTAGAFALAPGRFIMGLFG